MALKVSTLMLCESSCYTLTRAALKIVSPARDEIFSAGSVVERL